MGSKELSSHRLIKPGFAGPILPGTSGNAHGDRIQPRNPAPSGRQLPRLPALEKRDPDRVRRRPAACATVLVGEQPGDKEDLAGKPFVGPAGQMLDRALEEAGIDRSKVYVTNAVKHFKFVPRGKFRLHQKPTTPEIKACRPWYERELAAIKPDLVVAMGATAAQSVFGKITPINKNRGRLIDLDDGIKALVTVHPSYLLRLPDAQDAKAREYERFVEDLKIAATLLRKSADGSTWSTQCPRYAVAHNHEAAEP